MGIFSKITNWISPSPPIAPDFYGEFERTSGIFFGNFNDRIAGKFIGWDGHVLVVGGSGSGKSSCIAIPTLEFTWKAPAFVVDIKGELLEKSRRKGFIFNPLQPDSMGYDPFYMLQESRNPATDIKNISLTLCPILPNVKETFFPDQARSILTGHLLYCFRKGGTFIEAIRLLLEYPDPKKMLVAETQQDKATRIFLNQPIGQPDRTFGNIMGNVHNAIIDLVNDPDIVAAFSKQPIITPHLLEKGCDVFLQVPQEMLTQWRIPINLIVQQFCRHFQKRPESQDNIPILFLLDEFPQLGKMDTVISGLDTLRSKKITIMLLIQSLAQLDEAYGQDTRKRILDNCPYKAILKADDADTQQYFSRLVGTEEREKTSYTQGSSGSSTSTSTEDKPRIKPEEFANLKDIVAFCPEFVRVAKVPYYTLEWNATRYQQIRLTQPPFQQEMSRPPMQPPEQQAEPPAPLYAQEQQTAEQQPQPEREQQSPQQQQQAEPPPPQYPRWQTFEQQQAEQELYQETDAEYIDRLNRQRQQRKAQQPQPEPQPAQERDLTQAYPSKDEMFALFKKAQQRYGKSDMQKMSSQELYSCLSAVATPEEKKLVALLHQPPEPEQQQPEPEPEQQQPEPEPQGFSIDLHAPAPSWEEVFGQQPQSSYEETLERAREQRQRTASPKQEAAEESIWTEEEEQQQPQPEPEQQQQPEPEPQGFSIDLHAPAPSWEEVFGQQQSSYEETLERAREQRQRTASPPKQEAAEESIWTEEEEQQQWENQNKRLLEEAAAPEPVTTWGGKRSPWEREPTAEEYASIGLPEPFLSRAAWKQLPEPEQYTYLDMYFYGELKDDLNTAERLLVYSAYKSYMHDHAAEYIEHSNQERAEQQREQQQPEPRSYNSQSVEQEEAKAEQPVSPSVHPPAEQQEPPENQNFFDTIRQDLNIPQPNEKPKKKGRPKKG